MNRCALLVLAGAWLAPLAARGDTALSASQIEVLEQRGWITPAFDAAARKLIAAKQASQQAKTEEENLEQQLPALQKNTTAEDQKVAQLQAQLARYDHPDETDFTALQAAMKNRAAKPQDQLALALAYTWTYPSSPHADEAAKDVQKLQKLIADHLQAAKEADAAQRAAQLKLLQRAKAHDLTLGEWRTFLQDKSQDEVQEVLGDPARQDTEGWTYLGDWTIDPATNLKAGLHLSFNGGRVQNVSPVPTQ